MSQISSVYHNQYTVQVDLKPIKKQKLTARQKGYVPKCKCMVCDEYKPTKKLNKRNRQKFKSKKHPICNACRARLTKLGIYQSILGTVLFKINHQLMDGDTEYKLDNVPMDNRDNT